MLPPPVPEHIRTTGEFHRSNEMKAALETIRELKSET